MATPLTDADIARHDSKPRVLTDADIAALDKGGSPHEDDGMFSSFVKGLTTFKAPLGAGSVVKPGEEKAALEAIRNDPATYILDQLPFAAQYRKVRDQLKSGKAPSAVLSEMGGELMAGALGAPPVPVGGGAVMQPAGRMSAGGMVPEPPPAMPSAPSGPTRIPSVPAGVVDLAGMLEPRLAHGASFWNRLAAKINAATDENAAARPQAAAPAQPATVPPASSIIQPGGYNPRSAVINSEHGVLPPLDRSQFFRPMAERYQAQVEAPAPQAPPPAPVAPPAPAPVPEPVAAAPAAPALAPEAAAQATKFADFLKKSNLNEAAIRDLSRNLTDRQIKEGMAPAWENLARHLGESVPKAATIQEVIRQLRDTPAESPIAAKSAVAVEEAPTELEQQLEQSIKAIRERKITKGQNGPVVSEANAGLNERLKTEAAQRSTTAEQAARTKKAIKLGSFLKDHGIDSARLDLIEPSDWAAIAKEAGFDGASAQTIQTVKDLMRMGRDSPVPEVVVTKDGPPKTVPRKVRAKATEK